MDASLHKRAEQLATEFASQARTAEDLNGLMRLMMKSALERMLNTELDVHLGRRSLPQTAVAEPLPEKTPPSCESVPAVSEKLPKQAPNRRNGKEILSNVVDGRFELGGGLVGAESVLEEDSADDVW
jgi:hypothetical protein